MGSVLTFLKIINASDTDILKTEVEKCYDHDFCGLERPDYRFQGVSIDAGQSTSRKLLLNRWAKTTPFTMTLYFRDGTKDQFRIDQSYALHVKYRADFAHLIRSHLIDYKRKNPNILKITIENTLDQLKKKQFDLKLQQAGEEDHPQGVLDQLDEALLFTDDTEMVNKKKAETLCKWGEKLLHEAWKFDSEHKRKEASAKLDEAKKKYKQALSVYPSKSTEKLLKLVEARMIIRHKLKQAKSLQKKGNKLFNEARDHASFVSVKEKYDKVLSIYIDTKRISGKYQTLENNYIEGKRYGADILKVVDDRIKETKKKIQDTELMLKQQ